MTNINNAKDLTKEAPRSPYVRLGGIAILARAIDKCRAAIEGTQGEYNFDCPVDNKLFDFLGLNGQDFKGYVAEGHTDEEIMKWVKSKIKDKTKEETEEWSDSFRSDWSLFIRYRDYLGLKPSASFLYSSFNVAILSVLYLDSPIVTIASM